MAQGTRHRCALGKGEFSPYPAGETGKHENGQSKAARDVGK